MIDFKTALEVEQNIAKIVSEIKNEICEAVASNPLPGVKTVGKNSCVVSVSMLKGTYNLSPSYYIQDSQARIVRKYLAPAKTATEIMSKIKSACESGKVVINKQAEPLNEATLSALKAFLIE